MQPLPLHPPIAAPAVGSLFATFRESWCLYSAMFSLKLLRSCLRISRSRQALIVAPSRLFFLLFHYLSSFGGPWVCSMRACTSICPLTLLPLKRSLAAVFHSVRAILSRQSLLVPCKQAAIRSNFAFRFIHATQASLLWEMAQKLFLHLRPLSRHPTKRRIMKTGRKQTRYPHDEKKENTNLKQAKEKMRSSSRQKLTTWQKSSTVPQSQTHTETKHGRRKELLDK